MLEIRKLDGGDYCVDLGTKWYRARPDGTVVTKQTTWRHGELCGSIKTRPATKREAEFARAKVSAVITGTNS